MLTRKGRCFMTKGTVKKRFAKKIATVMMAAAMVAGGSFGMTVMNGASTVYAADSGYRGYHTSNTTTKKEPETSSTKKSKLSTNHTRKKVKRTVKTQTSTALYHAYDKESKKVTKTVTTTTKVYYKKTLTTTVKKQRTITTTNINYVRSGYPNYNVFMGSANTQIPTKIGDAMRADGVQVRLNSDLDAGGVYSASTKTIQVKKNIDHILMHEIGHYVDQKSGKVSDSTEFRNIFNAEKSNYKGFYSVLSLDNGNYARTKLSDYFAECFRDYYYSADSRSKLKANCPRSYNFIQKVVNNF